MPIPKELKEKEIWTLSSPDKIPLDLYELYETGLYKPLQLLTFGRLYNYETVKKVQKKHPETYVTIHSDDELNITLVDIEQQGVYDANPFLYLDFIYFETSKSGGRHGILLYKVESLNNIIKDKDTETEFFKSNHFMIITEKELKINEYKYDLYDFEERLKPDFNPVRKEMDATSFEVEKSNIYPMNQVRIYNIDVQPYTHQTSDESVNEFRYVRYIVKTIQRNLGRLTEDELINCTIYMTNLYLPYREKHRQYANFQMFGYISKRLYLILRAVYSILEK